MRMKMKWAVLLMALALGGSALGTELVVYTYDSFVSWGPAAAIEEAFQARHPDVDLIWVAPGAAAETLARLEAELASGGTGADVLLGIGDPDLVRASRLLEPYDPGLVPNLAYVPQEFLTLAPQGLALPFDQGYVTFVYDSERLPQGLVPRYFSDLLRCDLGRKIILEDPRTSSTGRAFLLWTVWHFGARGWQDFWRALLPNVLTITKGWSEAYDMFLSGEAPIVLSYSTDTAYSYLEEASTRYRVVTLGGEAYRLVEWMGIVAGTDRPLLAHDFLDVVLSREVQELIPTTQWMFPVNQAAELPEDFARYAVVPEVPTELPPAEVARSLQGWLRDWQSLLGGG